MRTFSSGMTTLVEAAAKKFVNLLEIDTATGMLRYVDMESNFTFNTYTYVSKSFVFPSVKKDVTLAFNDVTIMVANLDQALDAGVYIHDLRGRGCRVKQVFLNSNGTPGGTAGEYIDLINGIIEDVVMTDPAAQLRVRNRLALLDRIVPTRTYANTCPWLFGGTECGYDAAGHTLAAQTVDSGSTTTDVVDAARSEAANYWKDGVITITSGALSGQWRRILSSSAGHIVVEIPFATAPAAGVTYTIAPGCDRQYATCDGRYSNQANFGGFVNFPPEGIYG